MLMTAHMKGLLRVDNYASAEHHERASTQMNPEVALQVAGERWRGRLYCLFRWLYAAGPGVCVDKVSNLRVASDTNI